MGRLKVYSEKLNHKKLYKKRKIVVDVIIL